MKKTICVKCGIEATVGSFCDDCFLAKNKLFEIDDFVVTICDCGAWQDGKWKKPEELKNIIAKMVEKKLKSKNKIKKISLKMRAGGGRTLLTITAHGYIMPCKKDKMETKEISVRLKKIKCDTCVKLSGRYHEAVFQVRGHKSNEILKDLSEILPKNSWMEHNKDGVNVYFLNKGEASKIARQMRVKYEVKKSFKILGAKDGRSLIRDFYSIR